MTHTGFYKTFYILARATSGMRRRPWLHLLSVITLCAAFLSFGATLTAAINLDRLISLWVNSSEITVYLRPGASDTELKILKKALIAEEGVKDARPINSDAAKKEFLQTLGSFDDIGPSLPVAAFPPSLDVKLEESLSQSGDKRKALAARLAKVPMVQDVELYDEWYSKLDALNAVGKTASWGLGLLAAIVAILVVAATVRTGVAARRREISVMRYVGATARYVRLPFLIEGATEALLAMMLALLLLGQLMDQAVTVLSDIMPLLGGGNISPLTTTQSLLLLTGGWFAGLVGARLSLTHIEDV